TIGGEDSEILQEEHYYPFGMNMEGNWVPQVGVKNKYLYNGKELNGDFDLNWLDYGARWYDPAIGRWNAVDPLADQFAGWSSYNYVLNNPIRLIDPDGRAPEDVIIVFNRSTRRLAITDLDHYKSGLPSRTVSASNYVQGGIRNKKGELTHNQILVIDNVFSGGKSSKGKVERDPNNPMHRAIPVGDYDVLDNNADTRHSGWFRLDSKDDSPYNDKDETTGRDGFRLHIGSESYGCVTCDGSDGDRSSEWPVLEQILNTTSTTEVKEKRGNQWLLPWSKLTKYGTLKVQGKDNIPSKKEEKKND
ncbi:MAG: RHS repeat-associated protein, partial [Saprospiraceae bacterium]